MYFIDKGASGPCLASKILREGGDHSAAVHRMCREDVEAETQKRIGAAYLGNAC